MAVNRKNAAVKSSQQTTTNTKEDVMEGNTSKIKSTLMAMFEPRDPSSLAVLRIVFGLLMMLDIPQERGMASLPEFWGDPDLCRFPFFNGLKPLPLEWMYMVYLVMFTCSFGIFLGLFYRLSCLVFVISYWYVFLLEKSVWNNHSYLYGLVGIMLLMTNAHYCMSIDGLIWHQIRNVSIPRWQYGIVKLQFILVYFYAGLKKLDADWVHGYSMSGLGKQWVFDPFRYILSDEMIDYVLVHLGGLIFDLSEGFLLFFDKTRPLGFFLGSNFHLMNSQMFSIGMFPWTMLATMPIFCAADWPKRVMSIFSRRMDSVLPGTGEAKANITCSQASKGIFTVKHKLLSFIALVYVTLQLVLPYSHSITAGYNAWTQGIYGYSWDMMVHVWSTQHIVITVVDKPTNKVVYLRPGSWLHAGRRNSRWSSHPDMIKQYAVCLSERLKGDPEFGVSDPAIYFDIWRSMNGRFQQRLVDPRVDLVTADWSPFRSPEWVRPILSELSPWRQKLKKIARVTESEGNLTDIVFVADFPGLFLENYIDAEVKANISVLHGSVAVEFSGHNHTLNAKDSMMLPSNTTHKVYTVSTYPACYMYNSQNITEWTQWESAEPPTVSKRMMKKLKWANKTLSEKATSFLRQKYFLFKQSFVQSYYAAQVILLGPESLYSESQRNGETRQTDAGKVS